MDIVIYTNPEVLLHKRESNMHCWWSMKRLPKNLEEGDKIYFAVKGEIKGYFIFEYFDIDLEENDCLVFYSDTWVQLDCLESWIFCKPFRGFRYKWW